MFNLWLIRIAEGRGRSRARRAKGAGGSRAISRTLQAAAQPGPGSPRQKRLCSLGAAVSPGGKEKRWVYSARGDVAVALKAKKLGWKRG
ncbi:hypothetical protein VULLAG_LOCUS23539 [Vulpes lagopus]